MDTNILIHNLTLLAKNPPEALKVEADGVTLNQTDVAVAENAQAVFQVVEQMRQFTAGVKRPIWIKLDETKEEGKGTEIIGLKADQIFDRTLKHDLSPEHLERHKTITLVFEDDAVQPIEVQVDGDFLVKNSGFIRGMLTPEREYGVVKGEGIPIPGGIKKELFLNVMEFMRGAELSDADDPEKLKEYFRIGSILQYDALMDEAVSRLALRYENKRSKLIDRLLTENPGSKFWPLADLAAQQLLPEFSFLVDNPELLNRMVELIPGQKWESLHVFRVMLKQAITHFDQQIKEVNVKLESESTPELLAQRASLEDSKLQCTRAMAHLIFHWKIPFSDAIPGQDISSKLETLAAWDLKELQYVELKDQWTDADLQKLFTICPIIKILKLNDSPTISELPTVNNSQLEVFEVRGCTNLEKLSPTHTKLKKLILQYCEKLTSLPSEYTKIQSLILYGCKALQTLPSTYAELRLLGSFYGRLQMPAFPATYTNLEDLRYDYLYDDSGLMHFNPPKQIPATYTKLKRVCGEKGNIDQLRSEDFWKSKGREMQSIPQQE